MFDIDYILFLKRLLPWHKRKPIRLAFINVIANVMKGINNQFLTFISDTNYKLTITNQKIYLEHYLNDLYDPVLKRIFIQNLELQSHIYHYTALENKLIYEYTNAENMPYYLKTNAEQNSQYNYTIWVPNDITYDENQLKSYVNKYNPVGKIYQIQTF